MFYSYMIFDEFDVPFYVGKGTGERANTLFKFWSTPTHNKHVKGRIRNIQERGYQPELEIINCANELSAFWIERMLIAAFGRKDNKTGCLLNHTDGGEGCSGTIDSAETRRKKSINMKKKWADGVITSVWNKGKKTGKSSHNKVTQTYIFACEGCGSTQELRDLYSNRKKRFCGKSCRMNWQWQTGRMISCKT